MSITPPSSALISPKGEIPLNKSGPEKSSDAVTDSKCNKLSIAIPMVVRERQVGRFLVITKFNLDSPLSPETPLSPEASVSKEPSSASGSSSGSEKAISSSNSPRSISPESDES